MSREIEHYNLDAILAVGYRVRSERGTQFRRWATERLGEYLVKGFTMDDQRLYLRVREIFALAGDYDCTQPETTAFFQTIQNKLHFAATGKTAPELIAGRADHSRPNMGLTAWKGDVVRKADVTVAKKCFRRNAFRRKIFRGVRPCLSYPSCYDSWQRRFSAGGLSSRGAGG